MSGKEKISKSLSRGVILLVFLLLLIQLGFFTSKVVNLYKIKEPEKESISQNLPASGNVTPSAAVPSSKSKTHSDASHASDNKKVPSDSLKKEKRQFSLMPLPPKPEYTPKPKIDLNVADSASLTTLYGIGPYYAAKIIDFRRKLGGSFACTEQLMDIAGIDSAKFVEFENRIIIDTSDIRKIDLYTYPLDSMSRHPYIGKYAAKGIERFRSRISRVDFSIEALVENNILSEAYAQRMRLYQ